ncbi:MAG: methyltransferase domain-containing protein [Pirellulaceae bacterium]
MSHEDRTKWNERYADSERAPTAPSLLLTALEQQLPMSGRALDIAGGGGRHAIWLARRGLDATVVDISQAGLAIAEARARAAGVALQTRCRDLEVESLPEGPWNLIVSFHFLLRSLFAQIPTALAPGGLLVVVQPTLRNLERHDRPPAPYLLEEGELPRLAAGLEVLHYEEGWLAEGRHDALLVARRAS